MMRLIAALLLAAAPTAVAAQALSPRADGVELRTSAAAVRVTALKIGRAHV